jgi:tyrosyl-tRNA synthetase
VIDLLVLSGLCKSKGEARRLIDQGGAMVDGEKVEELFQTVSEEDLRKGVVLKKGKKAFHKVVME